MRIFRIENGYAISVLSSALFINIIKLTEKQNTFSAWLNSSYAQQYLDCERPYLCNALRQVSGPRVLQMGRVIDSELIAAVDFPQLVVAGIEGSAEKAAADMSLSLDPAFLPIQADTMATVVVPHVLERHTLPHQVLREAHRVLMPEGHIILTGFNPFSALGIQKLVFRRASCPGNYITVNRVSDWLQLLGFEIVASATFQYAPLLHNERLRRCFNFLNLLGDRWLPMLGGGYMITARKKQLSANLLGNLTVPRKLSSTKRRRKLAVGASSKQIVSR